MRNIFHIHSNTYTQRAEAYVTYCTTMILFDNGASRYGLHGVAKRTWNEQRMEYEISGTHKEMYVSVIIHSRRWLHNGVLFTKCDAIVSPNSDDWFIGRRSAEHFVANRKHHRHHHYNCKRQTFTAHTLVHGKYFGKGSWTVTKKLTFPRKHNQ